MRASGYPARTLVTRVSAVVMIATIRLLRNQVNMGKDSNSRV